MSKGDIGGSGEENSLQRRLVAQLARMLGLERGQRDAVAIASLLHTSRLLFDPTHLDPLDSRMQADIAVHVEVGAQIAMWQGWSPEVAEIIRHHHEHWDGSGWPNGLSGDEIPISAFIVAVANEFDHESQMGDSRLTVHRALVRIRGHAGARFPRAVVEAFIRVVEAEAQFASRELSRSTGDQADNALRVVDLREVRAREHRRHGAGDDPDDGG